MSTGDSAPHPAQAMIMRIAKGDVAAFSEFYDRASGLMYSVAHRILGTDEAAEAGLQTAFMAVWKEAGKFSSNSGSPLAWAVGLTRRACLDQLAKRRTLGPPKEPSSSSVSPETAVSFPSSSADTGDSSDPSERWALIPHNQRQALELAFFGGLTPPEISHQLGIPADATKTCIAAGLRHLLSSAGQFKLENNSGDAWPAK